jgi:DNA adenine methylase
MTIRPPFKIHGGKYYLSQFVIENFPPEYEKYDYVEPYVGAGSVLLNKKPAEKIEVINDIDPGAIQIYFALRDEAEHFIGRIKKIKYCEDVFEAALCKKDQKFNDYLDHAINEYVLRRMSRGGLKKNFAWSDRTRGGQPGDINAWKTMLLHLPVIAERIKGIHIFNKEALEVIKAFNDANTLLYCDPPYVPDTRATPDAYEYEMSTDDHIALAEVLDQFKGKVLISGYPSALYKRLYANWRCLNKKIANHASQQGKKKQKTECLWVNY